MQIENLNISGAAKKLLKDYSIDSVEKLLQVNEKNFKLFLSRDEKYRYYFDEVFAEIKRLGLHFKYEYISYYPYLSSKCDDLEQIKISYLDLTPTFRKYFEKYENLLMFFSEIVSDSKKLKKFLYENIKVDEDYTWLFELLGYLGNNGAILRLNIYKYQSLLTQNGLNFNSLLEVAINDNRTVQALNRQDIYFMGDLVKYSEQGLKTLEGVGPVIIKTIKEELKNYGLSLEMQPQPFYEFAFSLSSFDIEVLHLDANLESKAKSLNILTLDNLFFSNKVEFFTPNELVQIRNSFKNLGFDVNKGFLGATVSGDVLEYNNLILQKKLLENELAKVNNKLAGLFPMMYSNANCSDQMHLLKK